MENELLLVYKEDPLFREYVELGKAARQRTRLESYLRLLRECESS